MITVAMIITILVRIRTKILTTIVIIAMTMCTKGCLGLSPLAIRTPTARLWVCLGFKS